MKTISNLISKSKYVLLAFLVVFSFSCSPEDGDTGPQGSAGIDGTDGVDGTDGADGADGADGNANVIYSNWFEPVASDYSVNNSDYKALPIELPGYNPDTDALLVYYYTQYGNNLAYSDMFLLPHFSIHGIDGTVNKSITFKIRPYHNINYSLMYINIDKLTGNLNPEEYLWEPDPSNLDNKGVRFRYMIIAGDMISNKHVETITKNDTLTPFKLVELELSSAGVNKNNYDDVRDYYGINY